MVSTLRGKAQTVLGAIDGPDMGVTLPHEHLLSDFICMFKEPQEASQRALAHQPLTLQNRGWVNYHWTENLDNVRLWDEDLAVSELGHLFKAGARTVVDATSVGIGRDPHGLARIARMTGLNIIMGSGHYLSVTHPRDIHERTVESIAQQITDDITVGVGDTGIRAGFIGEIGCTYPWGPDEQKCLAGAVLAQRNTGAALMVHPGRSPDSPIEILHLVKAASGDLSRTIICHIDRTCTDPAWLKEVASTGCYLEYDLFGNESSYYPPNPSVDMPSDAQRMDILLWHVEQGHERQILLSHDVATKNRLRAYGGLGYDHLLTNVVPRMRQRGLTDEHINTFLVENPARVFCLA
jgi:phosphotriesterase-related protein